MKKTCLCFLALAIFPRLAFASVDLWPRALERVVLAEAAPPNVAPTPIPRALRILAELGGGILGGAAGTFAGFGIGYALGYQPYHCDNPNTCPDSNYSPDGLYGGLIGLAIGTVVGVALAGAWVHGPGSILGATLGFLGGLGVTALLGVIWAPLVALVFVLPLAFGVVGYELIPVFKPAGPATAFDPQSATGGVIARF